MKICEACGASYRPAEEPDPCLGYLPGVSHACCGHGSYGDAYVVIGGDPGQDCRTIECLVTLYGIPATEFFDLIKWAKDRSHKELLDQCPISWGRSDMLQYSNELRPQGLTNGRRMS